MKNISVVIPAYNEEVNILSTLEEVVSYLKSKFRENWEVIVVDDGSRDNTANLVVSYIHKHNLDANVKLLKNNTNKGKGFSVKRGMLEAKGILRLFMDADNSTKIRELDKMLSLIDRGYDIIVASRRLPQSTIYHDQPFLRRFIGKVYHILVSLLLGLNLSDYSCGFKLFKREAADFIFSRQLIEGWIFDAEVLFIGNKANFLIKDVPVGWIHKDTTKVRPFKDALKSVFDILKIKLNHLSGKYK